MQHVERLKVMCNDELVGTLAMAGQLNIVFQYTPHWLANGFDLAPQSLIFNLTPQTAKDPLFNGLHGVFNDSLPDGWGLLLMDREFKRHCGWDRHQITPLDRLAYIGKRAMGALAYVPEYETGLVEDKINLSTIAASVERVLSGNKEEVLTQLRIQGGSPGGARPKVTVALSPNSSVCLSGFQQIPDDYQHWLVKFRSKEDPPDMGRAEKSYADMATLAGIQMPETRLQKVVVNGVEEDFFSVRRFDRDGNKKHHVITMAGLFYANFRLPCIDYKDVLLATSILTKNISQLEHCFRLMVFNVLAHNKDDHAKNFSFIRLASGWELSPAYDLTFSYGMGDEHTTAISGSGNPGPEKLFELAAAFHLSEGAKIVAEVRHAVSQWSVIARKNKVSFETSNEIGSHLGKIETRFQALQKSR